MNKLLIFFFYICFFFYPINSIASSVKSIGERGEPKNVGRVIKVKMYDNYYEPNLITVKKGETIKFVISNLGEMVHEYNIGTKEMHIKHQPEMQKLIDHEIISFDKIDMKKMKEMSKKDHSLGHSHSNSIMLEPQAQGEIIWKFSKDITLEMACNIPGHYESGMVGKIIIK
tara:strand:- start:188 stop:700 length:513 start_codon:yes stop_codon:yes gene_type:complete